MIKMILSDLLMARSSLLMQVILCTALGLFFSYFTGSPLLALGMTLAIFSFGHCVGMPMWDEQNDWQSMRLAMPYSRRQIVGGRYCSMLVMFALGTACSLVVLGLSVAMLSLVAPEKLADPENIFTATDVVLCIIALSAIILISCAGEYFLGFAFGLGKVGKWIPAIIAVIVGVVAALLNIVDLSTIEPPSFLAESPWLLFLAGLGLAVIIFVASWIASARLYERRSF